MGKWAMVHYFKPSGKWYTSFAEEFETKNFNEVIEHLKRIKFASEMTIVITGNEFKDGFPVMIKPEQRNLC